MQKLLLLGMLFSFTTLFAQYKDVKDVEAEGKLLYRMEKGSWFGTDHFLDKYPSKTDSIGGYVSYENKEDHTITTVFINRYNPDAILVRYVFDSVPKATPLGVDTLMKAVTSYEKELFALRIATKNVLNADTTNFFTYYKNTQYNVIPLIKENGKKLVYILTGPQNGNEVLLGNDYMLTFTKQNELDDKMKLHNSMLAFSYKGEEGNVLQSTYHSHVVTELITVTDICTLLLYKEFVEWKQHIVVSKKWVSVFNLETGSLLVMKKKAWDKIYNNKDK